MLGENVLSQKKGMKKKKKTFKPYLELVKPYDPEEGNANHLIVTSLKLRANVGFPQRASPTDMELTDQ